MLSASEYQQVNRLTGGAAHAWFKPRFRGPADRGHWRVPQRASRSAVRCATVTTWCRRDPGRLLRQPSAHGETAHAAADQQRRPVVAVTGERRR
jgi:hypothetical protein